jgi:hypothetical protein
MAEAGILARSEIKVMIKNSYLADTTNDDIDIVKLTPTRAFEGISATKRVPCGGPNGGYEARGISVNAAVSDSGEGDIDRDATHGFINYRAKNCPTWNWHEMRYQCGVVHPINIRYIRCAETTARGIIVHG